MDISFADLRASGRHAFGSYNGTPVVAHDDDRWIVPVLAAAACEGVIKAPTLLVSLDRHHDACNLRRGLGNLPEIRKADYPAAELIAAVESHLASSDDDWIKAGMELGLIGDAIVWGVDPDGPPSPDSGPYLDHTGAAHQLFIKPELPMGQLEFKGSLSDLARRDELQPYWDAIGWDVTRRQWGFHKNMRCALNIDLDCFAIPWEEFLWPWPEEVWEARFTKPSTYSPTSGMTTQSVLRELLDHADLITIAREPGFTGGRKNGRMIEEHLRRYLFGGKLELPPYELALPGAPPENDASLKLQ